MENKAVTTKDVVLYIVHNLDHNEDVMLTMFARMYNETGDITHANIAYQLLAQRVGEWKFPENVGERNGK